jgi:hypothetical protein
MVEHGFRKAGVMGSSPVIGCCRRHIGFFMTAGWFEKNFFGCVFYGVVLNLAGGLLSACRLYPFLVVLGEITLAVGIGLLMVGLAFYARSKHRHPAWCILGLLSVLGLVIIVLLPPGDKTRHEYN